MSDFRATIAGNLSAAALPWSFGFYCTGAVSESAALTTINTAVTALFTTATSGLQNFMATDVTLQSVTVSTLDATLHQTTKSTASNVVAGTDANPSLPKQLCIAVTTRSTTFTKSGHGRFFLPPFATDTVAAGGVLSNTVHTDLQTRFNAFFSSIATGGLSLFIQNRKPLKNGTAAGRRLDLTTYDIANVFREHRKRVSKEVPTRIGGNI